MRVFARVHRFHGPAAAVLLLTLPPAGSAAPAEAQGPVGIYYKGPVPGSAGGFSPLSAVLHSGFYNFQIDNRGDDPFAVPFGQGLDNVLRNLTDPIDAVSDYGFWHFMTTEVLPTPKRERGQWVPNYFGHVFGEGLVYRYDYEWYRYHRVPYPRLMAVLSVLTGAMVNEAVENGAYEGTNVDPVADFYIFNPLGILLFSSDGAARFLHTHLGLAYWPLQLVYDPVAGTFDNVGYRTVFRWHPGSARVGVFATYGSQGLLGLSFRAQRGVTISAGAGAAVEDLVAVPDPRGSRTLTATMGPAAGVFVDRDGSLLASLLVTPEKADAVAVNVYPGVLGPDGFQPGLVVSWGDSVGVKLGVTVAQFPIGFGIRTKR